MARGRGRRSLPQPRGTDPNGEHRYGILLTIEEVWEIIRLIDDDEVDEEFLGEIRIKLFRFQRRAKWSELALEDRESVQQGTSAP